MHRLRSFLSVLGVVFGVVAVIAMLSIGEGAREETLEQIEQLGMNNIIIRQPVVDKHQQVYEHQFHGLNWRDAEMLQRNVLTINHLAPMKVVDVNLVGTSTHFAPEILAVTRAFGEIRQFQLGEGRFLCDHDQNAKRQVCVLGYDVAQKLGREGHVGQSIRLENGQYEIVGILQSINWKESKNQTIASRNFDRVIFVPFQGESPLSSNEKLSEITLQIKNPELMDSSTKLAKAVLERQHGSYENYQIVIPQELFEQANRTQKTFNFVLGSIAGISLLVGGIGIMNIMMANVSERTREIGIRRAVGANQRDILRQFLLETLFLTLLGALIGVIFGVGFSMFISYVAGWRTVVTLWSVLLSLLMSIAVGLCAGLYPAYQAGKMNPIQSLRHN